MTEHPLADSDAPCPAGVTAPDGETYPVEDGIVQCPPDVGEQLRAVWRERGRLDEPPAEEDGPPDVDSWHDWNESDWLDLGYEQRAEDVREGRVDNHLDAVADCERSETVLDAVEERRAELEV